MNNNYKNNNYNKTFFTVNTIFLLIASFQPFFTLKKRKKGRKKAIPDVPVA
jgi:hypothetical protein